MKSYTDAELIKSTRDVCVTNRKKSGCFRYNEKRQKDHIPLTLLCESTVMRCACRKAKPPCNFVLRFSLQLINDSLMEVGKKSRAMTHLCFKPRSLRRLLLLYPTLAPSPGLVIKEASAFLYFNIFEWVDCTKFWICLHSWNTIKEVCFC